jgi:uncharacterized repeat protein (TIGR03803 family)
LLLAGCSNGGTVTPQRAGEIASAPLAAAGRARTSLPTRALPAAKPVDTIVYDFLGTSGAYPTSNLLYLNGMLYGTTANGGADNFGGTVFALTPSGAETVLHSFGSGTDGSAPLAGLIDVKDILYGTTSTGGANDLGTVFSITPSGAESVLYSFKGGPDGAGPKAALLDYGGTLYGTTSAGGKDGLGTVFKVSTSGVEKVLYSFTGGSDGSTPEAALIAVGGKFYGTTAYGGGSSQCNGGCGTVFAMGTGGKEAVLYSFGGSFSDGSLPQSGLIDVNGTLYGTTYKNGASDFGTIYSLSLSGTETVLHSFAGGTDGGYPFAGLIDVSGTLYGTTESGGSPFVGTVYSVTTGGFETTLYAFNGPPNDGKFPRGGLVDVNSLLYGTTQTGGTDAYGTVFAVTP